MARSQTLQQILDRARFTADMRNSPFVSDATALMLLNDVWPKLYDELVQADANYYATSETFSISSGTQVYDLPTDFYKILGVDFSVDGQQTFFTLYPFNEGERNTGFNTGNLPAGTIRLRYVPAPVEFTSLSDSIDGIAGWDRMLSLLLAIDMLDAEESNTDRVYRKYQEEVARIRAMAPNRDMGSPATVTDVYQSSINAAYNSVRYRMYGDTIEFISMELLGVYGYYD